MVCGGHFLRLLNFMKLCVDKQLQCPNGCLFHARLTLNQESNQVDVLPLLKMELLPALDR